MLEDLIDEFLVCKVNPGDIDIYRNDRQALLVAVSLYLKDAVLHQSIDTREASVALKDWDKDGWGHDAMLRRDPAYQRLGHDDTTRLCLDDRLIIWNELIVVDGFVEGLEYFCV